MAATPKLTPEQWAALRVEWEVGGASNLELAAKYGVGESAIRKRARDTTQPGGAWRREPTHSNPQEIAQKRVARRAIRKPEGASEGANDGANCAPEGANGDGATDEGANLPPIRTFPAAPLKPAYQNPTTLEMADPAFRAVLREEIIDSVAEALAQENSQHIESRVGHLKTMFARLLTLLTQAMTTPDPTDAEAVQRQAQAQAALIVGRGDSVSGHLQALIKLSESIQTQMRRALGVEDRMKRVGVELSGPGGAPIQSQQLVATFDMTKLSTADMERLYEAALIIEGGRDRPPVPLPPGGETSPPWLKPGEDKQPDEGQSP